MYLFFSRQFLLRNRRQLIVLMTPHFKWTWSKESYKISSGVVCNRKRNITTTKVREWRPRVCMGMRMDMHHLSTIHCKWQQESVGSELGQCWQLKIGSHTLEITSMGTYKKRKTVSLPPPSRTGRHSPTKLGWEMDIAAQDTGPHLS